MNGPAIVDEIDRLLTAEEPVPHELLVDLLVALPRPERERWIRLLMELAFRPANLPRSTS